MTVSGPATTFLKWRHLTVVRKKQKTAALCGLEVLTLLSPRAPSSLLLSAAVSLKNQETMWFLSVVLPSVIA